MLLPVLAVALAAAPTQPAAPAPEVVEEVVAVVRNPPDAPPRIVTLTRLVEEARIVLVSRGATEAAFRPIDRQALRATLEWVLDQTLLADEAARLQLADVAREAVAVELRRFQARFPDGAAYARFLAASELAEEEVAAVLARTLRVASYLQSRVGRTAAVADDEVQEYVRANGLGEVGPAAREAVRARIAEARLASQVRELVTELRSRADVRILDRELAVPEGSGMPRGGT
jgi:hypothetical protein